MILLTFSRENALATLAFAALAKVFVALRVTFLEKRSRNMLGRLFLRRNVQHTYEILIFILAKATLTCNVILRFEDQVVFNRFSQKIVANNYE